MKYEILENHTVVVKMTFHGDELSGMSHAGHDEFNPEFGKALARVRLEKKIARMKEGRIAATRSIFMRMIASNSYDNKAILMSFNELDEKLKNATWYRRLQAAMVKIIKDTDPAVCNGFTEREIIMNARDKALELVPKTLFKNNVK